MMVEMVALAVEEAVELLDQQGELLQVALETHLQQVRLKEMMVGMDHLLLQAVTVQAVEVQER
tara:strand:- start:356 stop:544 length:189 start_codon:yes stop_codon:yes gene_type:complete